MRAHCANDDPSRLIVAPTQLTTSSTDHQLVALVRVRSRSLRIFEEVPYDRNYDSDRLIVAQLTTPTSNPLFVRVCACVCVFAAGYTSSNLMERGIHEVSARRFVLISADHPSTQPTPTQTPCSCLRTPLTHCRALLVRSAVVAAISENANKLQVGDISMMPEFVARFARITRPCCTITSTVHTLKNLCSILS